MHVGSNNSTLFFIFCYLFFGRHGSCEDGLWLQLVDELLDVECHTLEIMRCINVALLCVQENASDRPTMSDVVTMLSSETMTTIFPRKGHNSRGINSCDVVH